MKEWALTIISAGEQEHSRHQNLLQVFASIKRFHSMEKRSGHDAIISIMITRIKQPN